MNNPILKKNNSVKNISKEVLKDFLNDLLKNNNNKSFDVWSMKMNKVELSNTFNENLLKVINLFKNEYSNKVDSFYLSGINLFDYLNKNHSKNEDLIIYYKSKNEINTNDFIQSINHSNISFIKIKDDENIVDVLSKTPFSFQQCAYDYLNHKLYITKECRETMNDDFIYLSKEIKFKEIDNMPNKSIYMNSFNLALKFYNFSI